MSVAISSPGLNRFNMDWFAVEGPYAKVKKGYESTVYEALEKMQEAQKAASAQAREKLTDLKGLTQEQLDHLRATYDPKHMTYDDYRSFLDDLCQFGYFAEEDKPLVSCGVGSGDLVLIPVSSVPHGEAYLTTAPYIPGYASSFPFNDGNVLAWTKYLSTFGTYNPSSGAFEKSEKALLFEKLQNILLQM